MPPHILGGLIRSQSLVCTLAHQPVGRPRQKAHFADQLGQNPGIARVQALRDDALGLGSARDLQESLPIADMVVAVLNGSRRAFDESFQALLSFEKGQPGQLLAVEKQEIKDEVHKVGGASLIGRGLHLGKGSRSIGTNRTQLAVDISSLGGPPPTQIFCGLLDA
jgi:hypothetical protein